MPLLWLILVEIQPPRSTAFRLRKRIGLRRLLIRLAWSSMSAKRSTSAFFWLLNSGDAEFHSSSLKVRGGPLWVIALGRFLDTTSQCQSPLCCGLKKPRHLETELQNELSFWNLRRLHPISLFLQFGLYHARGKLQRDRMRKNRF